VLSQERCSASQQEPIGCVVSPDWRRDGIGTSLMRAAEEWATERGSAYLALATRRAADFYEAIGYSESATFFRKVLN
jgi:GNAT superfamily N-acetyltransferase